MAAADIIACEMTRKIQEVNKTLKLTSSKICPVENAVASPVTEQYRNKCEFTIGTTTTL